MFWDWIQKIAKDSIAAEKYRVPVEAQLTGSTVEVDGVTYQVSGGNTLRGTDAIKPDAVLAHAAIPYCFYFAIDTGVLEATNGTNWAVV